MLEALESSLQGLFNFWKSFIVTLQGVTARAHRSADLAQLSPGDAPGCWRVIRRPGHLGRICQASGDCFSFFFLHGPAESQSTLL